MLTEYLLMWTKVGLQSLLYDFNSEIIQIGTSYQDGFLMGNASVAVIIYCLIVSGSGPQFKNCPP